METVLWTGAGVNGSFVKAGKLSLYDCGLRVLLIVTFPLPFGWEIFDDAETLPSVGNSSVLSTLTDGCLTKVGSSGVWFGLGSRWYLEFE